MTGATRGNQTHSRLLLWDGASVWPLKWSPGYRPITSTEIETVIKNLPANKSPGPDASIRVFYKELALCIRWPTYWSFSFSISPSNEYSGLISFRVDWFDLLVVQGTLKSLLQHHSSKASILSCSAFFMVQLSHPYMSTDKSHTFDYTQMV